MRSIRSSLALTAALGLSSLSSGAGAVPHYVLDQAKSTLEFSFTQAGALNKGKFTRFPVTLDFAPDHPGTGRLEVTVDIASLDTGDQERDDTLKGEELFAAKKFPQAHFLATTLTKTAAGFEAQGKLTIRDQTRELRVPCSFRSAVEQGATVGYMSGKTSIRRLDYGVGQGDWKATDQVANEVGISFSLRLTAAP
jgi:polyisoprenoid-binding protein YceI